MIIIAFYRELLTLTEAKVIIWAGSQRDERKSFSLTVLCTKKRGKRTMQNNSVNVKQCDFRQCFTVNVEIKEQKFTEKIFQFPDECR